MINIINYLPIKIYFVEIKIKFHFKNFKKKINIFQISENRSKSQRVTLKSQNKSASYALVCYNEHKNYSICEKRKNMIIQGASWGYLTLLKKGIETSKLNIFIDLNWNRLNTDKKTQMFSKGISVNISL